MSGILDLLKVRLETAKQRVLDAEAELSAAKEEVETWSKAVALESRQTDPASQTTQRVHADIRLPSIIAVPGNHDVNRAALIRETIQQHPEGIKPLEILESLKGRLRATTYLYAVLKRLRDSNEAWVTEDGRYIMRAEKEVSSEEKTS